MGSLCRGPRSVPATRRARALPQTPPTPQQCRALASFCLPATPAAQRPSQLPRGASQGVGRAGRVPTQSHPQARRGSVHRAGDAPQAVWGTGWRSAPPPRVLASRVGVGGLPVCPQGWGKRAESQGLGYSVPLPPPRQGTDTQVPCGELGGGCVVSKAGKQRRSRAGSAAEPSLAAPLKIIA